MNRSQLRTAIAKLLTEELDVPVRQGWSAAGDLERPFVIFNFGNDLPSMDNPVGMWSQVEFSVAGSEGDYNSLDVIADEIISILHGQTIDITEEEVVVGNFRPEYHRDTRMDDWSEKLKIAIVRFRMTIPGRFVA